MLEEISKVHSLLIDTNQKKKTHPQHPQKKPYQLVKNAFITFKIGRYQKVELWIGLQISDPK